MKNKKGFTLVELLAVIVILAVLVLIAVPRVVGILNSIKQKTFATEAENIIKSAKNAYSGRSLDNLGIKNCYTLSDLNDYTDKNFEGYSGSVYINPETNEYKIWLSKSPYIINGSLSGDIKVTELIQYQPASVSCEDIEILACASYKYTLYVDAYGGKFSDNSTTKTYEMQSGETQEVVVPAKAEHTFGSWRVIGSPESFVDGVVTMGEQNVTLVAEWGNDGAETRKLYVNPDGGNWDNFTTTQEYDIEEFKTKLISTPTRFGYIFDGWEITGSPQSFVNELFRMGEEDVSLKALWTPFYTYTGTSELLNVDGKWKLKLKTDGDLVFNQDLTIDVFLVGGGGGGGYVTAPGYAIRGGGGSGRTKTVESIPVVAGESYTVDIGNGGSVNTEGGTTTAFATITSEATVSGGNPGRALYYTHSGTMGGSGGSGGGAWGAGGTNGGNGASYSGYDSGGPFLGGAGLDATTREFGEPSGTIYAYGGAGTNDYCIPINPPTFIGDNTGTGGNGGAAGYSGVVIIRVHTSTN